MSKIELNNILPICYDPSTGKWVINLAGMEKHSPTGPKWGYAPFAKQYDTEKEAKKVRKEIYKTIKKIIN